MAGLRQARVNGVAQAVDTGQRLKEAIRAEAAQLGFAACGFARADAAADAGLELKRMARGRASRDDGLDGGTRATSASRRTALWPEAQIGDRARHELCARDRSAGARRASGTAAAFRSMRRAATITRRSRRRSRRWRAGSSTEAAVRAQGVRRHRAGDGKAAGARRPGSAGRASTPTSSAASMAAGCSSA